MTAIALVSVINHYHINELQLFRDILYNIQIETRLWYLWIRIKLTDERLGEKLIITKNRWLYINASLTFIYIYI